MDGSYRDTRAEIKKKEKTRHKITIVSGMMQRRLRKKHSGINWGKTGCKQVPYTTKESQQRTLINDRNNTRQDFNSEEIELK